MKLIVARWNVRMEKVEKIHSSFIESDKNQQPSKWKENTKDMKYVGCEKW